MSTSIPPNPQQVPPMTAPIQAAPAITSEHMSSHPVSLPVEPELIIYTHSNFFYWWPVWVVGFILAVLSRVSGTQMEIGNTKEWFLTGQSPGVIFAVVLFLVIVVTNVSLRGMSSVVVILTVLFLLLLLSYFGWWDTILGYLPNISVHMNMGFYIFFSTLIFLVWAGSVFIYDRMSYWKIRPGQITHEFVIGGAEKSYDTRGMVFEKFRNDMFRHWLLGFGSADLHISTMGAKRELLSVPNVLFADAKVHAIQEMISLRPEQFVNPPAA